MVSHVLRVLPIPGEQERAADMRVIPMLNKSRLPDATALLAAVLAGPLSWQAAGAAVPSTQAS
jgi:hypothetical protein